MISTFYFDKIIVGVTKEIELQEIVNSIIENIERVDYSRFKITDERLLTTAGGIVQGMSGSPIVQNGKIIGAVTHVFVNDPTRGYGVYVDWMVDN